MKKQIKKKATAKSRLDKVITLQGEISVARLEIGNLKRKMAKIEEIPDSLKQLQDWRERALAAESKLSEQAAIRNVEALERRLAEARGLPPPPTKEEWKDRALKAEHALSLGAAQWDGDLSKLSEDQRLKFAQGMEKIAAKVEVQPDVKYWQDRFDKAQAAEDAANKLVTEWSSRAVSAEGSLKYAQDTLDQFKREDEDRALAIREIVRPLGFDLFAPMDAVREMAKLTFSLRDELSSLRAAPDATYECNEWKDRALKAEARIGKTLLDSIKHHAENCPASGNLLGICNCRVPVSNLDKPAAQEEQPLPSPDCSCCSWAFPEWVSGISLSDHSRIGTGTWFGKVWFAKKDCKLCGGTGYRRKDSPGPLPPDAAQSATSSSRLDVGQFRATEGELKEALKLWHEGKVCTCPGGQQHHRVGNSECYYEPREEGWKSSDPIWPPRKEEVKEKPLRLLVEIVSKKDEKHGIRSQIFENGIKLETSNTEYSHDPDMQPVMSFKRLSEMPTLEFLALAFTGAYHHKADTQCGDLARMRLGLRAVLAACGLEVE